MEKKDGTSIKIKKKVQCEILRVQFKKSANLDLSNIGLTTCPPLPFKKILKSLISQEIVLKKFQKIILMDAQN